jgi:magnesium-transporting ATPase (P-type)
VLSIVAILVWVIFGLFSEYIKVLIPLAIIQILVIDMVTAMQPALGLGAEKPESCRLASHLARNKSVS